jgi:hypothetical protein
MSNEQIRSFENIVAEGRGGCLGLILNKRFLDNKQNKPTKFFLALELINEFT